MKRNPDLLTDGLFDLLIIGGGITGAGVALDATLRGYRVALVDKGDFAGGTSSVSSKLIHGGLRYLEHGQFRLVYEALHERRRLLQNAPHLVWPLRFVVPVYRDSRVPRWKLRLGMTAYDLLAGSDNLKRSGPRYTRQLLREFPTLIGDRLRAGAAYYDAQMDDARLCLEVVKTAVGQGTCAANYVEVIGFEKSEGKIQSARVVDKQNGREFTIRARQFVNAGGPWVDRICKLAGESDPPHLQPTKGVHLILPNQGFSSAFLFFHPRDGRVFFVIPWFGKTLIGTTDTVCDESPDHLVVRDEDIAYLLEGYNHHFRNSVEAKDIMNSFVGLRPLIRQKPDAPSSLSREYEIIRSSSGLLSVVGGKYTTYRAMAEAIVDKLKLQIGAGGVSPLRGRKAQGAYAPRSERRKSTNDFKLDGTPEQPWLVFLEKTSFSLHQELNLSLAQACHLVERYGRRVGEVARLIAEDRSLAEPIIAAEPDLKAELVYQREHEMALFSEDHLLRRTRLGVLHPWLLKSSLRNFGKPEGLKQISPGQRPRCYP